jgi:hypothetical protein
MLAPVSVNRKIIAIVFGLVLLVGTVLVVTRKDSEGNAVPAASAQEVTGPLTAAAEIVSLDVPGTRGARASVPLGATEPRPVVIVLHGKGESAGQYCKSWREISSALPFVLCPELTAEQDDGQVEAHLRGALRALKDEFAEYVGKGPFMLAGAGSRADVAIKIAQQEPSFFNRLILVEGGYATFSATTGGTYRQRGGQRVLFACASRECSDEVRRKIPVLRSQDLAVDLVFGGVVSGPLDPLLVGLLTDRFAVMASPDPPPRRVPNPRGVVAE